jgi:hypothetical protein
MRAATRIPKDGPRLQTAPLEIRQELLGERSLVDLMLALLEISAQHASQPDTLALMWCAHVLSGR